MGKKLSKTALLKLIRSHEARARRLSDPRLGVKPNTPCVEIADPRELKRVRAAVVAASIGRRPKGKHLCHRCDNPACAAVGHFFWGSREQNMCDMVKKGRHGSCTKTVDDLIAEHLAAAARYRFRHTMMQLRGEKRG